MTDQLASILANTQLSALTLNTKAMVALRADHLA